METNWILLVIVIIVVITLIVFLIWRNQKDKKELTKNLIDEDEASIPKEPDTEIETAD